MISQDQLFNEYYFDLLKKLKTRARDTKHDSHESRVILRAIKKNYSSYDKFSGEFRAYVKEEGAWDTYAEVAGDVESLNAWVAENGDVELFKEIPLSTISAEFSEPLVLHHFLTLLTMLRGDLAEDVLRKVVEHLKQSTGSVDIENTVVANLMTRVQMLQTKRTEDAVKAQINSIPNIENTSLGKLAKEIMEEMNVEELQSSLGNGDIMQALANPDGGLVKLLGTVSQKMISKMSSGEIKQENLLQDAMKLAGQIGGKDMSALGNMASMFGGDMGDLAKMMGSMMGGGGSSGSSRVRPNTANIKKMSKKHDLRAKLDKRREAKENVSRQVESVDEQ